MCFPKGTDSPLQQRQSPTKSQPRSPAGPDQILTLIPDLRGLLGGKGGVIWGKCGTEAIAEKKPWLSGRKKTPLRGSTKNGAGRRSQGCRSFGDRKGKLETVERGKGEDTARDVEKSPAGYEPRRGDGTYANGRKGLFKGNGRDSIWSTVSAISGPGVSAW